ncbi:MAG: ABC transporter ATP-binding protein [Gammaproteobacteria bacterium]|nr:ABC transporter ATP-binding protein [Gammaproteobacteria bacterium]
MEVRLKDLRKDEGGETWIHPTSLTFRSGAFNILLGETLSGKTTLLRLLAGLERPSGGEIWFGDDNATDWPVRRRNIAMVYQQFINYPNWRVYDNIASPLKIAGQSRAEIQRRVREVCELLQLTPFLQRRPSELSGGQQQRIALARALVKRAGLILLDEPLANLDYKLREELREELPGMFAGRGTTVVYATTEPGEALLLGGRTAALHQGRVCQYGETFEVFKNPANRAAAAAFSDPPLNCAGVEKQGGDFLLADGLRWPAPPRHRELADGNYLLGFRSHQLSLREAGAHIRLDGRIDISEISGSESILHFSAHGHHWVCQLHGVHKISPGERAQLYLDPQKCFLFDSGGERVAANG